MRRNTDPGLGFELFMVIVMLVGLVSLVRYGALGLHWLNGRLPAVFVDWLS